MSERRWVPVAVALAVGIVGGFAVGLGPSNGDAAVYWDQARDGVFGARTVHLGWIVLLSVLPVAWAADVVNLVAAGVFVWGVGELVRRQGGDPLSASLVAAVLVLPVAPFAEVDVPALAALVLAVATRPAWAAGLAIGAAVSLTPTALLALPWVGWMRYRDGAGRADVLFGVGAVVVAVGLATAVGGADWWIGGRGVLVATALRPGAALGNGSPHLIPVLVCPWVLRGARQRWVGLVLGTVFVLAPPDTPWWLLPGIELALAAGAGAGTWRGVGWAALAMASGLSALDFLMTRDRVGGEADEVRRIAVEWKQGDALVAPWSRAVRVSIALHGDPYGIPWRPPAGRALEATEWGCEEKPSRVWEWTGAEVERVELGRWEEVCGK